MTFSGVFPPAPNFPADSIEMEFLEGKRSTPDPRTKPIWTTLAGCQRSSGVTVYTAPALLALIGEGPGKASAAASGARVSVSDDEGAQQFAKPLGAAPGEFLRFLVAGISAGEPGREVGYQ
jgi:hypothetical protein